MLKVFLTTWFKRCSQLQFAQHQIHLADHLTFIQSDSVLFIMAHLRFNQAESVFLNFIITIKDPKY
jgi:hypothetical protein